MEDAPDLAYTNGTACWEQYMWRTIRPKDKSREFVLESLAKVLPMRLLSDRDTTRHVKAVDIETGTIAGYVRWSFPEGLLEKQSSDGVKWLSAQVPSTSPSEYERYKAMMDSAWWEIREDLAPLEEVQEAEKNALIGSRSFVCKFSIYFGLIARLTMVLSPVLDLLAVHPNFQRKGIATALVQDGIQHIKKLNIPIFLQAWKGGSEVYQKSGFIEIGRSIQDDTAYGGDGEYGAYFMMYESSAQE